MVGTTVVRAPDAPLGRADATRRWALRFADGTTSFAGVTRPEGERMARRLSGRGVGDRERAAIALRLPALLSDGAGPHLLGSDGALALALGPHSAIPEARIAMSEPAPLHRIGIVVEDTDDLWWWAVSAFVAPGQRIVMLDRLAGVRNRDEAAAWACASDERPVH